MGTLAAIKAAFVVALEAYKFLRELEAKGSVRLSPEAAKADRRRLQRLAVWFHEGENAGLRRVLKVDDAADMYLRDLLQSDLLTIYLGEHTSELDRIAAKRAIMAGAEGQEEPRVYPAH